MSSYKGDYWSYTHVVEGKTTVFRIRLDVVHNEYVAEINYGDRRKSTKIPDELDIHSDYQRKDYLFSWGVDQIHIIKCEELAEKRDPLAIGIYCGRCDKDLSVPTSLL